jgi:hypothetical protein
LLELSLPALDKIMAGFCEGGNEPSGSIEVGYLLARQLSTNLSRKTLYHGIPRNHGEGNAMLGLRRRSGMAPIVISCREARQLSRSRISSITHTSVSPDCFNGIFKAILSQYLIHEAVPGTCTTLNNGVPVTNIS